MRSLQWSKTKKQLEHLLAPSLKGRVQYHVINYRKAHDRLGRAVITVDKKEIINMCTYRSDNKLYEKEWALKDICHFKEDSHTFEKAHEIIKAEGIFAQYDFFDAVEEYMNMPIQKALQSGNRVIAILTLLDRRIGKRTLQAMSSFIGNELQVIQSVYKLRCEAEGMERPASSP